MVLIKQTFILCILSIAAIHCTVTHCASTIPTPDKEDEKKQLQLWMKFRNIYLQREERKLKELQKSRESETQITAAESKKD